VIREALIGLDVGTSALKALAISPTGAIVGRVERPYPISSPHPGWSEQDPEDWWTAATSALAELGVDRPLSIGVSGQMHGLVALDDEGRVIRPSILWNDQRTAAQCAEIERAIGFERLVSITGNRALTGFTAPKLLWLREHEPSAFERIATVMLPKDLVRTRLTGDVATDVTDASGTLLLDVARRGWSAALVDDLGLVLRTLPPVLESAAAAGATAGETVVAAGAGDQASAAVGVGSVRAGDVSVSLGTSGVVFAVLSAYRADPLARVHTFAHAVPQTWHAMGVMLSAGGSLRWFRDTFAPGETYERLAAEVSTSRPGANGVTFLPYLTGERTPHADPDARGAFVGLTSTNTRADLARAVLEGVAFGLRDCLEVLRAVGVETSSARISGGGARSDQWVGIVASALDLPLERTQVDEGAAFGAALLGGVASGTFATVADAVDACVHPSGRVEPDPTAHAVMQERYERFRELYPALHASAT
jgi:xylulokinase